MRINSEHGISFTEFSYMLLQANDYLWLHDNLGCTIQIGGSDQWGNIIAGVDLIRRKRGEHVHAFSWPLLTAADGSKLGKTTGARVWLDAAKTSPYQFRQHWMQIPDDEVRAQLLTFSLRPVDEIRRTRRASTTQAPQRRLAQRALADEMVDARPRRRGSRRRRAGRRPAVLRRSDRRRASAAFEALADEIPYSRLDAERARRHVQAAGRRTAGVVERRRPAQPRPGRVLRERRVDRRELRHRRVGIAPRPVSSAPQGQEDAPSHGDFFMRRVVPPSTVRLVLFSASRKGFDPPERRIWHQRQAPAQADQGNLTGS